MLKVIISGPAERDLGRLDRVMQRRIIQAIEKLAKNPGKKSNVKKLIGSDLYRLRVGNFRLIFALDKRCQQIRIATIGHRKEVYQ